MQNKNSKQTSAFAESFIVIVIIIIIVITINIY